LALQRLCEPGSDLQGSQWLKSMECEGLPALELQHLYRTVGFLHDVRADLEKSFFSKTGISSARSWICCFWIPPPLRLRSAGDRFSQTRLLAGSPRRFASICAVRGRGCQGLAGPWEIFPGNTADIEAFKHIVAA